MASVSEFVLQRIQIKKKTKKKIFFFFFCVSGRGGGGGGAKGSGFVLQRIAKSNKKNSWEVGGSDKSK